MIALSESIILKEVPQYNGEFPQRRFSDVTVTFKNGQVLKSGPTEADCDPETPLPHEDIRYKFQAFAAPVIGNEASNSLAASVSKLGHTNRALDEFFSLIYTQASLK